MIANHRIKLHLHGLISIIVYRCCVCKLVWRRVRLAPSSYCTLGFFLVSPFFNTPLFILYIIRVKSLHVSRQSLLGKKRSFSSYAKQTSSCNIAQYIQAKAWNLNLNLLTIFATEIERLRFYIRPQVIFVEQLSTRPGVGKLLELKWQIIYK